MIELPLETNLNRANGKLKTAYRALYEIRKEILKQGRSREGALYAHVCSPHLRKFIRTATTEAMNQIER
jgi:hypothetical protein